MGECLDKYSSAVEKIIKDEWSKSMGEEPFFKDGPPLANPQFFSQIIEQLCCRRHMNPLGPSVLKEKKEDIAPQSKYPKKPSPLGISVNRGNGSPLRCSF